ncbi:MAG: hypothetical protein JW727_03705 [Candidatus Aenigmarchaeota archaeon]|nr:hypothetical protein [Candidatus Aenigmarchaeota archaeon]
MSDKGSDSSNIVERLEEDRLQREYDLLGDRREGLDKIRGYLNTALEKYRNGEPFPRDWLGLAETKFEMLGIEIPESSTHTGDLFIDHYAPLKAVLDCTRAGENVLEGFRRPTVKYLLRAKRIAEENEAYIGKGILEPPKAPEISPELDSTMEIRGYCSDPRRSERPPEKSFSSSEDRSKHSRRGLNDDCYLTTACVGVMGLDDNGRDLSALRTFRDDVLANTPEGRMLLAHYEEVAPRIVEAVNKRPNAKRIWEGEVYPQIAATTSLLLSGLPSEAIATYQNMTLGLEKKYLRPN